MSLLTLKSFYRAIKVVLSTLEQISILCFDCFPLQSCHNRIEELFSDKIYLIGIAALVVAVIMVRTTTHNKNVKSLNNIELNCISALCN